MKLLIVEDQPGLSRNIFDYLRNEDFVCETAFTFEEALDKINFFTYDCIILDITLPDGNGLQILSDLKKQDKQEGVIIISAKDSLDDKIAGLTLGADDYLPKPFHLPELSARIKALIRRKHFKGNNEVKLGNLVIDLQAKKVSYGSLLLEMTKSEFELLIFLVSNKNRVVSKKAIAEHLAGDSADFFDSYDFIYTHLKNLKKKLAVTGFTEAIKSVYGLGYKFEYDAAAQ